MDGLLVIDKPAGITSHDVVGRVRRILGERRVGHAGTLDPPATGVLVLGIGTTTRLLRFCEAYDKTYVATVAFGTSTSTQDATGTVLATVDASVLERAAVIDALGRFVGDIEQVPPMVSAVKIGGERLYRKALRGEEVERPARPVIVHAASLDRFESGRNATASITVTCSKGTYIRTLAADLGDALGVGAHLTALRRTRVGPFDVAGAVALEILRPEHVRAPEESVAGYPRRSIDADEVRALVHGKPLSPAGIEGIYAAFGPEGLVAMMRDGGEEARSLCVVSTN